MTNAKRSRLGEYLGHAGSNSSGWRTYYEHKARGDDTARDWWVWLTGHYAALLDELISLIGHARTVALVDVHEADVMEMADERPPTDHPKLMRRQEESMRTERICRIEPDGTQTPMVLVPAASVANPEPIVWHQDGQGGFEYEYGEDLLLTVTKIESADLLVRFRCSVFLQSEATREKPIFRVSTETAEMGKIALQIWLDCFGSDYGRE